MSVTIEDIEALRRILTDLPRHQPRQVSKQEAIALLSSELGGARRRGYTPDELARILSERGVAINAATLRGYLRRNRKSRKASESKAPIKQRNAAPPPLLPASTESGTRTTSPVRASPPSPPRATTATANPNARAAVGNQTGGADDPRSPADSEGTTNAHGARR